jgi:hypothetical protein
MADFISTWASAIAQFEGFNTAGSRPARNNNPGDLMYAGQPGATGKDSGGFAIFPDAPTGWQALYNQLNAYVNEFPTFSILQIMAHYLGQSVPTTDSQGNAFTYANFVAQALGVDPSTTLEALAAGVASAVSSAAAAVTSAAYDPDAGSDDGSPPAPAVPPPDPGQILGLVVGAGVIFWFISRSMGW